MRGGEAFEIQVVDDFLGQRARVRLALLRQHHRGIRLVIAETEVRSSGDGGAGSLTEGGGKGGGEAGFEFLEQSHDGGWSEDRRWFRRSHEMAWI